MNRRAQSQWEFGELFSPEQMRRVLTVSELTTSVRRLLENELGDVWVTGEVTNLRVQASGHVYFTLKDATAQLSCVLFRNEAVANREFLQDGQRVLVQGALSVYEPRGQYQLIVRVIEPQGIGALQVAFEKLKRKLQAEGLFAAERKRPLPRYPRCIGLVTSPTGAAIRDVLHVIERRQPGLEIVFAPCRVQGDGAASEIAAAIRLLNEWALVGGGAADVHPDEVMAFASGHSLKLRLGLILVTRGGGSLEDLWAFNEEIVARAIFESAIPVVCGIGHEIDFTIADFVADMRAATPSAAAEIITEGAFASRHQIAEALRRLRQLARARLELERDETSRLEQRLVRMHPRRRLQEQLQYLDELQGGLVRCARQGWRLHWANWSGLQQRLYRFRPSIIAANRRQGYLELGRRLQQISHHRVETVRSRLSNLEARLRLLSPENVLARGYSITRDAASGQIITLAEQTHHGQRLNTKLRSGEVTSVVQQ
jgi:exodeoxyribonuclease VII large subunit